MRSAVLLALVALAPACTTSAATPEPKAPDDAFGTAAAQDDTPGTTARDLTMAWLACAIGGGWSGALDRPPHTWSPPSAWRCHAVASYLGVTAPKLRAFVPSAMETLRTALLACMERDRLEPGERAARLDLLRVATAAAREHVEVEAAIGRAFRGDPEPRAAGAPPLGRHAALGELLAFAGVAPEKIGAEASALAWLLASIRTERARALPPAPRALAVQPVLFLLDGESDAKLRDDPDRVLATVAAELRERAEALPACELRGVGIGFAAAVAADVGARRTTAAD